MSGVIDERLRALRTVRHTGRVVRALGTSLRASGLPVRIGERCEIHDRHGGRTTLAEVVGFERGEAILVPLDGLHGIALDAEVSPCPGAGDVRVGEALLGRVLDGFGQPMDGRALESGGIAEPIRGEAPHPLERLRIDAPFETGVRALDALLTVGVGQRVGLFAPAGVGKSMLLGMLARRAEADVIVVALIGERGREVREFVEDTLGERALARSVVIVSTSDRPAMERVAAAETATAVAAGFRRQGKRVLLLMDSVTRYARALREVGLAVGEPAVRQGFPPSVFAALPRLFERAGNDAHGSITAFYAVLADEEEGIDPVSEETRSILDGHVVLSRRIAASGRYPAIDVAASVSRLFVSLAGEEQRAAAERLRRLIARYRDIEFLVQVGEYKPGSDAEADEAIRLMPAIEGLVAQRADETSAAGDSVSALIGLFHAPPGAAPGQRAPSATARAAAQARMAAGTAGTGRPRG